MAIGRVYKAPLKSPAKGKPRALAKEKKTIPAKKKRAIPSYRNTTR